MCGYTDVKPESKMVHSVMNRYVKQDNPSIVVVVNRLDDSFESVPSVEGRASYVWIREDIYLKKAKPQNTNIVQSGLSTEQLGETGAVDTTNANAKAAKEFSGK